MHIRWRWLAFPVFVVLLAACATPSWPQFRQNAAGTGVSPAPAPINLTNVGSLALEYTADLGTVPSDDTTAGAAPPVVTTNGRLYAVNGGKLRVFDGTGVAGCAGAPKVCTPLWTAPLFGQPGPGIGTFQTSPAVVNGTVYVSSGANSGAGLKIEAFDAAGVNGCSGSPKVCTPLWSSPLLGGWAPAVVANNFVYATDGADHLAAFDANGQNGCAGTPKVCNPLWTSSVSVRIGGFAVAGTTIVSAPFGPDRPVYAFDALGQQNCSGSPAVCDPLWQSPPLTGRQWNGLPSIGDGKVYIAVGVPTIGPSINDHLWAFDLSGTTGCSGTPKVCTPLFTSASTPTASPRLLNYGPSNANGLVYSPVQGSQSSPLPTTEAFDANGVQGCSGAPVTCTPLWTYPWFSRSLAIVNNVVFSGQKAFDATGNQNCSGTPKVCAAVWDVSAVGADAETVVVGNRVFVSELNFTTPVRHGTLKVYKLP